MARSIYAMMISIGVAFLALVSSENSTRADVIWQAPETISGDGDVSTLGSLVRAWGAITTVNGVSFSSNSIWAPTGNNSGGPLFGGTSTVFAGLSESYRSLLDTGTYNVQEAKMTINLTGLTIGSTYEFQAFVNDSRDASTFGGGNVNYNRSSVFDSGEGSIQSQLVFQPLNSGTTNIGQFVKGTFTATSTLQVVRILGLAQVGQDVAFINAYQLRDISAVPEPSSILLLLSVTGIGGVIARRRLRNRTHEASVSQK